MSLSFYSHISTDEVARQLSNDAKDTLETLAALAEILEDESDADDFAAEMARQYRGLRSHRSVLPFLQVLTGHLQAVEDRKAATP